MFCIEATNMNWTEKIERAQEQRRQEAFGFLCGEKKRRTRSFMNAEQRTVTVDKSISADYS